ncbi:hypothetical protein D5F01_LYC10684 [Scomber scombrus]|uniref:Uncharacterized protein n=1 Tax=Scomber scombrus TaxID=13677 RepID=A0AAV1NK48_SCOSC
MDYCGKMPNPDPDDVVPQPPRQRAVPSYLLDYDLTGPGSQQWIRNRVPHDTREDECELLGAEVRSGTTTPISQISAPHLKVVDEEWEQMSKKMQDDQHPPPNQFPDPPIRWQQLSHENATLRHQASQVPELIVALKEMKQANTDLRQQVDDLLLEQIYTHPHGLIDECGIKLRE